MIGRGSGPSTTVTERREAWFITGATKHASLWLSWTVKSQ